MKKILLFLTLTFAQLSIAQTPCIVNIPDENFKNALVNNSPAIDLNGDGEIQCSEAAAYSDHLFVNYLDIEDLTGIEAFVSTPFINCSGNQLTSLDVSALTHLKRLDCNTNKLTVIDVSSNLELETLHCGENLMTEVDISSNTMLISFHATGSQNLRAINLKNGNNSNFIKMMVDGSPNLRCIQVDDPGYSTTNWIGIDYNKPSIISYTDNCFTVFLDIPELDKLNQLSVYPNPTSGIVRLTEISDIQIFDMSGRLILEQNNATLIDLSNQESGVYLLKAKDNSGVTRIIKE